MVCVSFAKLILLSETKNKCLFDFGFKIQTLKWRTKCFSFSWSKGDEWNFKKWNKNRQKTQRKEDRPPRIRYHNIKPKPDVVTRLADYHIVLRLKLRLHRPRCGEIQSPTAPPCLATVAKLRWANSRGADLDEKRCHTLSRSHSHFSSVLLFNGVKTRVPNDYENKQISYKFH